jgi:hypothetical protein
LKLLLQPLNLLSELLIPILQLLDLTCEVAEHTLKAVEPSHQVGGILRADRTRRERAHERDHKKRSGTDHSLRHFHRPEKRTLAGPTSKL